MSITLVEKNLKSSLINKIYLICTQTEMLKLAFVSYVLELFLDKQQPSAVVRG